MWALAILVVLYSLLRYSTCATFSRFEHDVDEERNRSAIVRGIRSTLNRDPKFGRWTANRVPYRIDTSYSSFQKAAIRDAMMQIQTDMSNCLRFAEFDSELDNGEDFINISPTEEGIAQPTCFTAPGRDFSRKGLGQPMVIFAGAGGCMDNKRDIMKVLANGLGLRNEFARPDRDSHLLVQPQNFRAEFRGLDLYRKYKPSDVEYQNFPFDLTSITMYSMERFAIPSTVAYHLVNPGIFIGNLPRLSKGDCQGLSAQYGCSASFCPDAYTEENMIANPKDKSISIGGLSGATWSLEDLNHLAKEMSPTRRPTRPSRGSRRRRPFLIRPIALL